MKKIIGIIVLSVLIIGGWGAYYYGGIGQQRIPPSREPEQPEEDDVSSRSKTQDYEIVEFARGLEVPWSIVFTSRERMLITERPGRIRVIENGEIQEKPLITFPEVSNTDEEGLMSISLDPNYSKNHYVYVSLAYKKNPGIAVKIMRFVDQGDAFAEPKMLLDNIPAAKYHSGSRLAFGPDGKLYISTGDSTTRNIAQDLDSLGGKILRINADGTIPDDNPFPNSLIWSYGHRNPQGLAWLGDELYETEHGPSGFDGPAGGDEVNHIIAGRNYGWPLVSHTKTREGTEPPRKVFTPAEAPASLMIYSGKLFPQFKNKFFFGALVGEGIVILSRESDDSLTVFQKIATDYGRIREVIEAPDGTIYFSTSNRDGRGKPKSGDDKIYQIRGKQ